MQKEVSVHNERRGRHNACQHNKGTPSLVEQHASTGQAKGSAPHPNPTHPTLPHPTPSTALPSLAQSCLAQQSTAQHSTAQHSPAQHCTALPSPGHTTASPAHTIRHQEHLVAFVTIADGDFLARLGSLLSGAHQCNLSGHCCRHPTSIHLQFPNSCLVS